MKLSILSVFVSSLLLTGCIDQPSAEEMLQDACIEKLNEELQEWAKYDGWDTSKAQAMVYSFEPNTEKNNKYKTDQFYDYEVIINEFTVVNGFGAKRKSVSTCKGQISTKLDDNGVKVLINDKVNSFNMRLTLNGNPLDLLSQIEEMNN